MVILSNGPEIPCVARNDKMEGRAFHQRRFSESRSTLFRALGQTFNDFATY